MLSWNDIRRMFGRLKKKHIPKTVAYFIFAFLLSPASFIFGSMPFGISLCASVSGEFYPVFAGVFIGSFLRDTDAVPYAVSIIITVAIRFLLSEKRFYEPISKRIIAASVGGIFLSVETLIIKGVKTENVIFSICTVLFCAVFTFLYSTRFTHEKRSCEIGYAGNAALIFSGIYALHGISIYGFYPSVILAFLFTIFTAMKSGFMKGGITGLAAGLACGADALVYAPLLGICGMLSGVIFNFSGTVAISSVLFISILYGIYATDVGTVESIFQNTIMVIILYVPISFLGKRFNFLKRKNNDKIKVYDFAMPVFGRTGTSAARIDKLSRSLFELSDMLKSMGKHQTEPTADELSNIIKKSMCGMCTGCARKRGCEKRKDALMIIMKLCGKYLSHGRNIPSSKMSLLPEGCNKNIINILNDSYSNLSAEKAANDSCLYSAKTIYDISYTLKAINEDNSDQTPNPEIAEAAANRLALLDIKNAGVYAEGKRAVNLYAYNVEPEQISIGAADLSSEISEACDIDFDTPSLRYDNNKYTLCFSRKKNFSVETSFDSISKNGENICGDSVCSFEISSNAYSLICDGMGSGKDAAATSRMACLTTQKLIYGGCSTKSSIELMNRLLIDKFDEIFTTLDMLEVDLFTGKAMMYKAGAASSVIIRKSNKYEVSARSAPAGIVDKLMPEKIKLRLFGGDIIVMMSDGALEALKTTEEVYKIVMTHKNENASKICSALMEKVSASSTRRDDATVSVSIVKKCDQDRR